MHRENQKPPFHSGGAYIKPNSPSAAISNRGITALLFSTKYRIKLVILTGLYNALYYLTNITIRKERLSTLHSGKPPPFQSEHLLKIRLKGK